MATSVARISLALAGLVVFKAMLIATTPSPSGAQALGNCANQPPYINTTALSKSYHDYVTTEILDPLGMFNSTYDPHEISAAARATPYVVKNAQFVADRRAWSRSSRPPATVAPLKVPGRSVGIGWFIGQFSGHTMLWKNGGSDSWSALVEFVPELRVAVLAFTNVGGAPQADVAQSDIAQVNATMLTALVPTLPTNPPVCVKR